MLFELINKGKKAKIICNKKRLLIFTIIGFKNVKKFENIA
jgi:hypothetical protein